MGPKGRITIKILELFGCAACLLFKIYTDHESRQLYFLNQKLSREWGLLHTITWSNTGNAFANITYGGYTLITALMVISRCIDVRGKPTILEKILLTVGVIMFFAMGGLVFAAIDQVPSRLQDNAIILGCLSFLVGFLFLFDLADPISNTTSETTQTDNIIETGVENSLVLPARQHPEPSTTIATSKTSDERSSKQSGPITSIHDLQIFEAEPASGFRPRGDDVVEGTTLPIRQSPVFEKINTAPEKLRAVRSQPHQSYRDSNDMMKHQPKYRIQESMYHQENRAFIEDPYPNNHQSAYNRYDESPTRRIYQSNHHQEAVRHRDENNYPTHQQPVIRHHSPVHQNQPQSNQYRHSSYVQGSVVDNENFILKKKDGGCCSQQQAISTSQIQQNAPPSPPERMTPITRGYVSNVAKMWEKRGRSNSNPLLGQQTNV